MEFLNIKKGKIFDKYRFRCNYCGNEYYKPLWLVKLQLMFSDEIFITCTRCHKTSCYRQIFNLRHDSTSKKEKSLNKQMNWDRRMI